MRLQKDLCSECRNYKHCCYKHAYDGGTAIIEEVLQRYKPFAEWYGTLKATCDYFIKDNSKEPNNCPTLL
jgi:hypothetical protein